ncbi:unnamed protein product [Protopolystoma xenopodis]|uniref:Uncharacterized protein n=1 Tax=Protopolystoma xenopodis TaxID=117903 RepID=A0A3S5AP08_9PLAT|nr:unnamed protein product [Protopolystoma xenopodis]
MSPAEHARELARPYLMEFLARAYLDYDIAIWSATNMTWILAKLSQLGLIPRSIVSMIESNSDSRQGDIISANEQSGLPFRICLLIDSTAMISVHFPDLGVKEVGI